MYTNKKMLMSAMVTLYLFSPISILANEENGVEETKQSIITFTSIQEDNKDAKDDGSLMNDTLQNSKEALDEDINLLVKETGFSEESVREAILFHESFGVYSDKILSRYKNQVSSIYVEKLPSIKGHIKFVDEVPKELIMAVKKRGQEDKIILEGGGRFSLDENYKRADLVSKALHSMKIYNTVIFFDQIKDKIQIEMKLSEKAKAPSVDNFIENIQKELRNSNLSKKSAQISEDDLNLKIVRGEGEIATLLYTRGGSALYDGGVFECTLGWSVRETSGARRQGFLTADHCDGIDAHRDHVNGGYYSPSPWRKNASGQVDVEFHETPTSAELAEFHPGGAIIRHVTGTRSTSSMLGNYVCSYGRSSNIRTCNHRVTATNMTIHYSSGHIYRHLARANNDSLLAGDSGGGWSWNNTAWGVTSGHGGGNSYFTPARVAEAYLGVRILSKCNHSPLEKTNKLQ